MPEWMSEVRDLVMSMKAFRKCVVIDIMGISLRL